MSSSVTLIVHMLDLILSHMLLSYVLFSFSLYYICSVLLSFKYQQFNFVSLEVHFSQISKFLYVVCSVFILVSFSFDILQVAILYSVSDANFYGPCVGL